MGPRVFVGIEVYGVRGGTLTITDDQGQFLEQSIVTGSMQSVTTGWTIPSTVVTIGFTGGWDLGVDNFVYMTGAPPPPAQYPVTVTTTGTGNGVVTSQPAGIDCGVVCSGSFDENTVVTLTATPASGSVFDGWSGDNDCADGQVSVTGPVGCTASFSVPPPPQFTLQITRTGAGNGTVTSAPASIDCGTACSASFDQGTSVTLAAIPHTDSEFSGWGGAADCADGVVTMNAEISCIANFDSLPPPPPPMQFSLQVTLTGDGGGTISSVPAGIACGLDCQETFDENTQVVLTALPDFDSGFVSWSGDADCVDGVVAMASNVNCIATFSLLPPPAVQYSLTVSLLGNGTGTVSSSPGSINCQPDCSHSFDENTDVVLTATASGFSTFNGWSGDADCADGVVTLTQDVSCNAEFVVPEGGAGSALRFSGLGSDARDRDRIKFMIDNVTTDADPNFPLDVGATDFTIEFWLTGDAVDNQANPVNCGGNNSWINGNMIIDRDRFNRPSSFGLSVGGGRLAFGVTDSNDLALTICGNTNILDGLWHHIAVQRSAVDGQMMIYVDGSLDAFGQGPAGDISYPDDAVPGNFCGTTGNEWCIDSDPYLVIGAEKHDIGPQYPAFSGTLDELRISDVLRYNGGFTRPTRAFTRDANTLGLFHFDEGAGEVVRDDITPSDGARDGVVRFGGDGSTHGPIWVPSDAPLDN